MSSIPHTRSLPSHGATDGDAYSSMMENLRGMRKGAAPDDRRRDEYSDGVYSEEARPALGVPVSDSSESDNDTLLNVEIKSSEEGSGFYIPVALMIEREEMMRETAQEFGIGADRWSDSLLYREWAIATDDDASSVLENRVERHQNGDVTLYLDPEGDCKASNHSHSLMWRPWLTTCMRAFYNTGTVRVPDDCMGSDILLALEYFGIVYTPDQLIFDSFGAYLRVKLWSEYFTHRSRLAQWVVQRLMSTNAKHSHNFVTSPSKEEGDILVGSKRATVIDGDLQLDPAKYTDTTSRSVVHDFFDDDEQPEGSEYPLDSLMRDDFASYVQHSLPGTRVTFQRRAVQMFQTGKVLKRSILHVDFISPSRKAKLDKKMATTTTTTTPTTPKKTAKVVPAAAVTPTTATPTVRSRSRSPAALFKKLGSGRRRSGSKDSRDGSSASIEPSPVATPTSVTAPIGKSGLRTGTKSSIDGSEGPQEPKVLKRFGARLRRSPSKSSIDGSEGGRLSIDGSQGAKFYPKLESGSESCEAPDISNEEFSPERQNGESSNAFAGPSDSAKLPEIKGVLSADHINVEMRKESKLKDHKKDQTSYSVDQLNSVFNGLDTSDEKKVVKESPRFHGSLPSDEKRAVSLAPSDERNLAFPSESTDSPAPVKLISYGDMTVASGITSPWREDEGPMFNAPYLGSAPQRSSRSAPSLRGALTDKVSNTTTRPLKPPNIQRKGNVAGVFEANSTAAHILEEGNESGTETDTDMFSSGNNTGTTTPTLGTVEESPVVAQCGADALSSAWCYMFGGSSSKKTSQQSDNASVGGTLMDQGQGALTTIESMLPEVDLLTHATPEVEAAYLKNKGKGETLEAAASTWLRNVVDFNQLLFDDPFLEADDEYCRLARKAEVNRPPAARPPSILRSSPARSRSPARSPSPLTCATLDAITDPVEAQPKSREGVPRPILKNPTTAPGERPPGTRVKDILDKLMRDNIPEESTALPSVGCGNAAAENDNTSAMESIVSTSASSKGTSLGSSAIAMTKDQYLVFGDMESICSSKCSKLCAEPADPPPQLRLPPGSPSSIGTPVQGSSVFIPKPMPIGKVGLIRSVSPSLRQRLSNRTTPTTKERKGAATPTKGRFPTPSRTPTRGSAAKQQQQQQPTPPRSPHHMGSVEERTRSPLARLPGLLPVRWGKRSSSTTSEATPVIRNNNNGDEMDLSPLEENDDSFSLGQNSQKSKGKIGGLFRAKGSALKRNLLDIRKTNSKEKEMVEKFKQSEEYQKMIAEGKLYSM